MENSSFSSARRYFARIFVATSTSVRSSPWRMRASRSRSPMACIEAYSGGGGKGSTPRMRLPDPLRLGGKFDWPGTAQVVQLQIDLVPGQAARCAPEASVGVEPHLARYRA